MSFLETIESARAFLERNGRVSLRALQREFNLDDGALDELIEELVEIQRVAVRDGRALAWAGGVPPAPAEIPEHERDPADYTPKHLADKILQSKSALEGERKQVTVLFADVKGSMELAETLDPEEWHGILDRFFQVLTQGVHRFEGTVNQYTGDGIMALFGAPIAHEDHAQRACYAALWLRDELTRLTDELRRTRGLGFAVRMGLNSGEVVVGKIGDDLRMDYTAHGQTVGLAQRMEQLAHPGSVYLTGSTARSVEGFFDLRDLGPFEIKGVSEPVPTFELRGVGPLRSRFDVSRARGLSRFVGRNREMAVLDEALQAGASGQPRIVGVVGEAGVGKSRLVHEFLERVGPNFPSRKGQCAPHTQSIPLLPVMEAIRDDMGIAGVDDAETCRVKITGFMLRIDMALAEDLPFMLDFLGVRDPEQPGPELEPAERIERLIRFANTVTRSRIERGVYAIRVIEDLHWMDDATEAYLVTRGYAMKAGGLSIFTYRPEYEPPFPRGPQFRELDLRPLSSELIDELLRDLLGPRTESGPLSEMIRSRCGGNPFFVEEIVLSLVESGALKGRPGDYELAQPVAELRVPASVQAVLAARIDRLSEGEKAVLQAASVIGESFPEDQLREITDLPEADLREALQALASAEFVYETAAYPRVEYTFKHAQTRDVAYDSQLQDARARTHAAVARSIESLRAEHMEENYALLAHHWERAREPLTAAAWSLRAAGWARHSDVAEAVRHYGRVLELVGEATQDPELEKLVLGACIGLLASGQGAGLEEGEPLRVLERGRAAAAKLGGPRQLVELLTAYGEGGYFVGHTVAAEAREALRLAEEIGDLRLLGRSRLLVAGVLWRQEQEYRAALELIEAVLADDPTHWRAIALRGRILMETGRFDDAQAALDRVGELLPRSASVARWHVLEVRYAILDARRGDLDAANRRAARYLEHGERHKNRLAVVQALVTLAECSVVAGRYHEAIDVIERAFEHYQSFNVSLILENLLQAGLVLAYACAGDRDRARELLERWRVHPSPTHHSRAQVAQAMIELSDPEELSDAEAYLGEIERLVVDDGAHYYRALHQECRAALACRRKDEEGRLHHLRGAERLYTEMGATGHAERVARDLAELG